MKHLTIIVLGGENNLSSIAALTKYLREPMHTAKKREEKNCLEKNWQVSFAQ